MTAQQFTFGDFVLDAGRRQVRGRDGALIPLTPRLFNALHLFVLRPGELLDKNELMRELWPGVVVEENSLSQVVSSLRRCLGEDGDQRRYIHTEPRPASASLPRSRAVTWWPPRRVVAVRRCRRDRRSPCCRS